METKRDPLELENNEPTHNTSMWVLSYCDLLCQLICFFVLLFSTTTVNKPQWEEMRSSLSQRLDPNKDAKVNQPAAEISIEKKPAVDGQDIGYLKNIIREKIEASALKDQVVLQQTDDRLVVSIAGEASFVRGNAHMTPQLESTLLLLNDIIRTTQNRVEIHGNADPNPTSGKNFPSNWELSLARALSVSNYLHERGYPYHLSVYGRGDTAYSYLPEGLSAEQRERLSRRIDIVIRVDRAELRP